MISFTWQVESVDTNTGSMVVRYTPGDGLSNAISLNLPMPLTGEDVQEHVTKFAPLNEWNRAVGRVNVEVGTGGMVEVAAPAAAGNETPQVVGSWNEEYLRALIYQVLEEMKESTV